eukprot:Skav216279  [mRNA]  locus=scaffold951:177812:198145:+ [translate_table: standard]
MRFHHWVVYHVGLSGEVDGSEEREAKEREEKEAKEKEQKKQQQDAAAKLLQSVQAEMMNAPAATPPKAAPPAHVQALFKEPEELDANGQPRKHKPLTRLDGPPAEERKLRDDEMRRLIQQVPTDKARAFTFDIDWDAVHGNNIIEKKLRPWVKKKVTEFLGNEEQGMIEFILKKVTAHTKPDIILAELEGFLDEEAENFTLKMWRMLIFEASRGSSREGKVEISAGGPHRTIEEGDRRGRTQHLERRNFTVVKS